MSSAILSPHTTSLTPPVPETTPSSSSRPRRAAAYRKPTNEQVSPAPTTASLSTNLSVRSGSRISRSGSASQSFQSPEKKSTTIVIRPKRSASGSGSTSTSDHSAHSVHSAQGSRNSLHSSPGSTSGPSGLRPPRRGRAHMRRSDEDEGAKEVENVVLGLDLGLREDADGDEDGDGDAVVQNGDVEMQGEEGESEIDPLDVLQHGNDQPDVAVAEEEDGEGDEDGDEEEDEDEGDNDDDDDDDDDDEYFIKQPEVISPTKAREKTEEVRRITLRFGTKPKVEPAPAPEPARTPAPEPEPKPEPELEPEPALGLEPVEQDDEADEIVKEEVDADADADDSATAELSEPPEEIMEVDEEPGDVFSRPAQPSEEVKSAIAENKYVPEAPKRAPRKKRKWLKKGEVDPDDPIAVARQKERHQMIDEAIADLDRQTEMIIDGTHPQLVAMLAELERRQALQLRWADRRHEAEFEDLVHMRDHAKEQAMFNWRVRRDALADEITLENAHKMSQLSMERNISRREPNTAPWLRDGQGGGGWTVYDEKILSKGTQKLVPVLVNGELRQRKDLSHNVSMLQSDEIDSDLIKLGLRKAPAPPMQIKRSRSESPPPIPVRAKASRTGESSRRTTHASVATAPAPPPAPAPARSHASSSTPASRPAPQVQSSASLLPLSSSSMSVSLAHPTPAPASASASRAPAAVPQTVVKKRESPDPIVTPSQSQAQQGAKPLSRPWYSARYGIADPFAATGLSANNAPKPTAGVDRANTSASSSASTDLTPSSKPAPTTRPAPPAPSTTNGFGSSLLNPSPAPASASQAKPDPYRRDDWRRTSASSAYNSPSSFGLFGGVRSSYGSPITANRLPSSSTAGSSAASRYGSTSLGGNRPLTSSFASPSVSPSSTPAGLSGGSSAGAGVKPGTASASGGTQGSTTTASVTGGGAGASATNGNTTGTGGGAGNGNGTSNGTGNGGTASASSANLAGVRRDLNGPGSVWPSRLFY